jgi:hypothetical protein
MAIGKSIKQLPFDKSQTGLNIMNFRYQLLPFIFLFASLTSFSQTQKDTIFVIKSSEPIVIDGSSNDAAWSKTDWHPISKVWIPYNGKMASGDFAGKFKVAWDSDYLYVLVEVIDNMISDDHVNPLDSWWDDDCVEVFLDEDRSKGYHEKNNNAFAYHVSTKYDAIDEDASGNGVNYKNNLKVIMDTIGTNTYLWEMAVKVYNSKFVISNPEASRVKLAPKKLMGFSIAYCDNDETTGRENFIGSMNMTAATANDNYITADYFGSMLLLDQTDITLVESIKNDQDQIANVYPNPANELLTIELTGVKFENSTFEIRSVSGSLLKSGILKTRNQSIKVDDLIPGIYFLTVSSGQNRQTVRFKK